MSLEVVKCKFCGCMNWKIYTGDNGAYIFCLECENEKRTKRPNYFAFTFQEVSREGE